LVEGLRVELAALALLAAGPDVGGLVVRVLRVGQGFEQAFVTAGAAAVVRRGRTLARGAARVFLARSGRQHFFERDQMQPAIAEVVFILQARVGPGQDIGHAVLPVGERRVVVEIVQRHPETRMAVPLTYGSELMQVGVSPGERALDGDVQVPESVVARHLQAAPDQGLDLLELDPDLEDGLGHGAPLLSAPGGARKNLAQPGHRLVTGGLARQEGFEPPTNGFGSHYSIRLSYRRVAGNYATAPGADGRPGLGSAV